MTQVLLALATLLMCCFVQTKLSLIQQRVDSHAALCLSRCINNIEVFKMSGCRITNEDFGKLTYEIETSARWVKN